MIKLFLKRQKGVAALETLFLTPYMLFIMYFLIHFCIFCTDYILMTNNAFDIAQNMNVGQDLNNATSYTHNSYYSLIATVGSSYENNVKRIFFNSEVNSFSDSIAQYKFNGAAVKLIRLKATNNNFNLPYVNKTIHISCTPYKINNSGGSIIDKDFSLSKNETNSGDMIKVNILWSYTALKLFDQSIFEIKNIHNLGYSFIV